MLESLYQKLSDIEAKIDESHRLAALLGEVQRSLAAEASHLIELKARLLSQQKEAVDRRHAAVAEAARLSRRQAPGVDKRVLDSLAAAGAEADQALAAGEEQQGAPRGRPTPAEYADSRQQLAEGKRTARDAARSVLAAAREAGAAPSLHAAPELTVVGEPPAPATPAEYADSRQQLAEGKRTARDAARSVLAAAREASAAPSLHAAPELTIVGEPPTPATPAEYADARQHAAEGKRAARDAARTVLTAAREAGAVLSSHREPAHKAAAEAPASASPAAEPTHASAAPTQPAEEVQAAEVEAAGPDAELRADEKRITEALEAGRLAMAEIDRCKELLQSVAQGGALHTIASAVFSKSPDHAKIDEARQAAHEARANLRKFQEQLAGLRHRIGGKVEAGELATLADRLLGHVSGEAPGEPGLLHALEGMRETYHDVRGLCVRLQREAIAVRARLAAMERARR